jgi:ADP-ribosylglycohydrolase
MDRRQFLNRSVLAPVAAYAAQGSGMANSGGQGGPGKVTLREKFFGCIAACHVGSALGAPCEGWTWQEIQDKRGTIDKLWPYQHYRNGWDREPGTTEDGVERQKLMITAIIEKQDRVTAEDVRKIWVRDMKAEQAGMISEPFEGVLLAMAKSGIPACDIGRYCDYAGLNSMSRACHAIPLINAGDIEHAVADVFEVGQLYQTTNSRGLQWAAMMGIAIASATKPGATVDSVIADILQGDPRWNVKGEKGHPEIRAEIERALKVTQGCKDFKELRVAMEALYSGKGTPYAFASASEVVTKGICIFYLTKGHTKDTMIAAVNMGRDTDCLTAVSSGIAGALSGASSIPEEWIKQVDYATTKMPVTNNRRTIRQCADGLYEAYRARLGRTKAFAAEMEQA